MDVAEVPRPGQPKELREASEDELVEVREPAIEVLEQCEFEEEDGNLEEIDQDKLEVSEDYVHLPDATWEDQYREGFHKHYIFAGQFFNVFARILL